VSRPIISVIIPAYNESDGILGCLESISAQTFDDFEIIVVDDGSKDNTVKVCEDYAEREPRLRVIKKVNGGVSSARNIGLENARGQFIYFADADDYVLPDCLKVLFHTAVSENADIVVGNFYIGKGAQRSLIEQTFCANHEQFISSILSGKNHSALWNKLFRRSLFDQIRFPVDICYMEDRVVLCNIASRCKPKIRFVSNPVYVYVQNAKSASNSGGPVLFQALDAHCRILSILHEYSSSYDNRMVHSNSGYRLAWYIFCSVRLDLLREALIKLDPFTRDLEKDGALWPNGVQYRILQSVLGSPRPIRFYLAVIARRMIELPRVFFTRN
jgi:glycosyltransferase involved in cell wall biosynthesis